MARQMTWHERREINLRIQRREGRLQSEEARPNPSNGFAASRRQEPATVGDTSPGGLDDDNNFPQPLQGFDYTHVG